MEVKGGHGEELALPPIVSQGGPTGDACSIFGDKKMVRSGEPGGGVHN